MIQKRLFIITNRLPVYFTESGMAEATSTGLASSMKAYFQHCQYQGRTAFAETYWVGVPGCSAESWTKASYNIECPEYSFIPVHVTGKMYHAYFHGIANTVIWPLFHYFPSYAHYDFNAYEQYTKVNEIFAETLLKHVREHDVIWIHDYHLLPLAAMLRKAIPGITIGFFLHVPFPSFEIFRVMPGKWQQDLIRGMLGADLLGFQTIDYARHFLESVRMIVALENDMHVLRYDNRLIKIDVFPISIDFHKFFNAFDDREIVQLRQSFQLSFGKKKIMLTIGKLNYTKGIFNRIKAYEYFLTQYPEFRNNVVFILVIVPSNDDFGKYAEQKNKIDEAISNINSKIGDINWQPITYQYNSLSFNTAVALYTSSDLAVITPLRDGMNLVSKEFVASRKDKRGVLLLSELAGAARELTGALLVNPNDFHETAEKMKEGLEMSEQEQHYRMERMQKRLSEYDVCDWAGDFLNQLSEIKRIQSQFQVRFFNDYSRKSVFQKYQHSKKRLILLDYDGTLVPFAKIPPDATAGKNLLLILQRLCANRDNDVFIISGRTSDWLDAQLGSLFLSMVAEHGAKIKWKGEAWRDEVIRSDEWKAEIEQLMLRYTRRCADTFIEEKEFSIVWHYRNAIAEEGKLRALELYSELNQYINHLELHVMMGNKIVEVRTQGIGKDMAAKKILSRGSYDFILAMGDDRTDEDMFKILADNSNCYSIKIGADASYAKYNLLTQQMAISFLENISALREGMVI